MKLGALRASPPGLLAALIVVVGVLAAVFSNDVVCLSIAPVLIDVCLLRRLDPVPFLLALACAANIGSAATLIGNPQNMLIGARLHLDFVADAQEAAVPVAGGLIVSWLIICCFWRGRWKGRPGVEPIAEAGTAPSLTLDRWQTTKGLTVAGPCSACSC